MYSIIHSVTGHFGEKNGEKYLTIDSTEVFSGIRSEIKTINGGEELFHEKIMLELELILTMIYLYDDLRWFTLKFPTLIIIIRCVFQKGEKLCPQISLDECLYEL